MHEPRRTIRQAGEEETTQQHEESEKEKKKEATVHYLQSTAIVKTGEVEGTSVREIEETNQTKKKRRKNHDVKGERRSWDIYRRSCDRCFVRCCAASKRVD